MVRSYGIHGEHSAAWQAGARDAKDLCKFKGSKVFNRHDNDLNSGIPPIVKALATMPDETVITALRKAT